MRRKTLLLAGAASAGLAMPYIGHLSAYANVLTRLIPDIYAALDVVSRELVGFLPSVQRNFSVERAAVNEPIVWHITPELAATDIVPSMAVPEPPDLTIDNNTMILNKQKGVEFGFTGEEQRGLNNGPGYLTIQGDLIAQAMRTLVNLMEVDLAVEAAANASRAYGTAGTTPFGGDKMTDTAQLKKLLDDNGAPLSGRSLILDTSAGANLRSMYNLTRANEAGTTMVLRDGELINLHNFSIKESAGIQTPAVGTGASATTNNAGYAVGATTITLAAAGTGTVVAGDLISFAGDANKYQVVTGDADVSNGGTVVISKPGLRKAIPAVATNITVVAQSVRNIGFSQDALRLGVRAPAKPVEGDLRIAELIVTDPRSGMTFEISVWPGFRKVKAQVAAVWGVKAVKRQHIVALLG